MNDGSISAPQRGHGPFVPMLLLALALLGWLSFQTSQLLREREQLAIGRTAQDPQVEAARKVRTSLDTVAAATAQLADLGNVNARLLVDELRKRGITINASAAPK